MRTSLMREVAGSRTSPNLSHNSVLNVTESCIFFFLLCSNMEKSLVFLSDR